MSSEKLKQSIVQRCVTTAFELLGRVDVFVPFAIGAREDGTLEMIGVAGESDVPPPPNEAVSTLQSLLKSWRPPLRAAGIAYLAVSAGVDSIVVDVSARESQDERVMFPYSLSPLGDGTYKPSLRQGRNATLPSSLFDGE